MITENLSTLKIHKLSQAQYERELAAGRIDENALYLTPDVGTHITETATLMVSGWNSLFQSVAVDNVTANNTVVITPAPSSHVSYCEAGVYCSAQTDGELTFTCASIPTSTLTVNVMILD